MDRAIFLDRDGVINEERGFVYKKENVSILPGVKEALKILKEKNYLLIVVTNQPAIARGLTSEEEVNELQKFINKELGNLIDKFYFCPHHPEMHDDVPKHAIKYRIICDCRKPGSGMILKAAKDFKINLKESWMIGDMITDIIAGKNAGCRTIMVKSPKNKSVTKFGINVDLDIKPDYYAENLLDAIKFID